MTNRIKKFVILSNPRTGSEYLVRLLQRHSSVCCLGEVFSVGPDGYTWNHSEFKKKNLPLEYLEAEFLNSQKPVCGYKQISYWIENSGFRDIQDLIEQSHRKGYEFILIRREDLLKAYVSFTIMMEQGYGHITHDRAEKKRIFINPHVAYMTLRKWAGFNKKCLHIFEELGIDYLSLSYERDFAADKLVKEKVFDFLKIGHEQIEDPLKPTNPFPIEELVINYQELHGYLSNKNWAKAK